MPHSHGTDTTRRRSDPTSRRGRNEAARHQRALRILVVVLIPLGIWTFAGLIALWPDDASSHINADVAGYSIAGVTYPTAEITAIQPVSCEGMAGSTPGVADQTCATIAVRVLDGDDTGKEVAGIPLTDALFNSGTSVGQRVTLIRIPPLDGQPAQYQFSDFERRIPLLVITLVFAAAVIFVARWRGFAALLGLGFAGFILVKFMFPALVSGSNPLLVGLVGSSAIMFVVLYAAHGFSARTSTALVGTLFGLVTAAFLGWGATNWAHLTGVTAEDDYVLAAAAPDLSLTSVVLVGIIVAGLGVLNDVTITQASAVWELADADPGPEAAVLQGHADRSRPHRLHRLHDRLRHGGRLAAGAAADRDLQPAAVPGAADRAVRGRADPDHGRFDRSDPRGASHHSDRGRRRPGLADRQVRQACANTDREGPGGDVGPGAISVHGWRLCSEGSRRARFVIRGWKFAD